MSAIANFVFSNVIKQSKSFFSSNYDFGRRLLKSGFQDRVAAGNSASFIHSAAAGIKVLEEGQTPDQFGRDICRLDGQDEAFYVCDIGDVVRKFQLWKKFLPRVKTFYAVKCNPQLEVIRALASLGTGFDCATKYEIDKVLGIGVPASRIIYANPAKPASQILHAATVGVDLMTFDNEDELRKCVAINPKAKLVLRIHCNAEVIRKYGCDALADGPRILQVARDIGADIVGVSFHIVHQTPDPSIYRRAITSASHIFNIAEAKGYKLNLLNLGGGFPGHRGSSLAKIADVINEALVDMFPSPEVNVIAEPGTFYAASACKLYTQIHSKRVITINGEKHVMYYINDSMYGSFSNVLLPAIYPVPTPSVLYDKNSPLTASSVWGQTCDNEDRVHAHIMLPDLEPGVDWLVYDNMGAYERELATTFNGFPIPRVYNVIDKNIWMDLRDAASTNVVDGC